MNKSDLRPAPNIFVVGDSKSGTSSLYRMIQLADGIATSTKRKEQHFFSAPEIVQCLAGPGDVNIPGAIARDLDCYLDEFAGVPPGSRNIVDVSPSYLRNPHAARRIRDFAPDARIVILLRDPAAKVFSQYVHLWSEGRETLPFTEAFAASRERREAGYSSMFDYEGGGFHFEATQDYFAVFGRDQVRVEIFEELFGADPAPRRALGAFLGATFREGAPPKVNVGGKAKEGSLIDSLLRNDALRSRVKRCLPLAARIKLGQKLRAAVRTEKPVMAPEMRARLQALYAEDARRLEALIGRPTGWPTAAAAPDVAVDLRAA